MNEEMIEAFLRQVRERHRDEIEAVSFPEGVPEYVRARVAAGDSETLLFMLKLGYLMGLQTGFAAGEANEQARVVFTVPGPMQA